MTETVLAAAPSVTMHQPSQTGRQALTGVPLEAWRRLSAHALEPNGFFDPGFALPAAAFAGGGRGSEVLLAEDGGYLCGLLPVVTAARAYGLPIPALVAGVPYAVLATPLLDASKPALAAEKLIEAAGKAGAQLLVLPMASLDGEAATAMMAAARRKRLAIHIHGEHERAALAVPDDAEAYLRAGMGAKKLKELRRLGHRLAEEGVVAFAHARERNTIAAALTRFLDLEARGWKGQRGTGLGQSAGDRRFIETAAATMAERGGFEVLELTLDGAPLASGLILRQGNTALFFKIAYDEAFARYSPGVQLTVELTRRLADDPIITYADSTALPGHPMIDHVWRERRRMGDLMISTRPGPIGPGLAHLVIARARLRERAKRFVHTIAAFREKNR